MLDNQFHHIDRSMFKFLITSVGNGGKHMIFNPVQFLWTPLKSGLVVLLVVTLPQALMTTITVVMTLEIST